MKEWGSFELYPLAKSGVCLVNDAPEKGVKLMTDYSAILSENAQQKDIIVQVVAEHRQKTLGLSK